MTDLTKREAHFEFGENWAEFAAKLTPSHVDNAVRSLARLLPDGLAQASFLDIGCGSGLSAVAAARLGAARIEACDIDENSVRTTEQVLAKFAPAVQRRGVRLVASGRWAVRCRAFVGCVAPHRGDGSGGEGGGGAGASRWAVRRGAL